MEVYHGIKVMDKSKNIVIALGNFDGVHLGHRELIRRTREIAETEKGIPAVFTFDPHPMKVLQPDRYPPMLLSREEKINILSGLGIRLLIITPFSKDISMLSPEAFVNEILVDRLNVRAVIVGYNYNFGYRGEGNVETLRHLTENRGIRTVVVSPVKLHGVEVSSTLIRRLLLEGKVFEAAEYLGYHPFVTSRVVEGDRRGRELGFPTANMDLPADILVPANGVYAVRVYLNGSILKAIANIGIKPTFQADRPINLEVHCLGFSGNLYGELIKVEFIKRIRGEQAFSSAGELTRRIRKDMEEAEKIFPGL
ncbi:MAG: riboflavin biosynthesis protein RibF [Firmicutes bacterium HGW-Firmicutes-14]|nr:MAG: riboflavin biosynthesis protein RibF [Firmicutes bacterium HGW-Firmicutes-14]